MITALLVDDERHNLVILQSLLKENCPHIQVLDTANSADTAFEKINAKTSVSFFGYKNAR